MNAIGDFFRKYNAVLVRPGYTRPDYTCALSTVENLREIAEKLAKAYSTANETDREHIARDFGEIMFEINVRFSAVIHAGEYRPELDKAFIRVVGLRADYGLPLTYTVEQVQAETAKRSQKK